MMKYFLATLALAFAAPVAAQTAPAHQDHQQHQQGQHSQHQQGQHCACCVDRNGNGRMDCCEEAARNPAARPQG
jgi:hypothetical protein